MMYYALFCMLFINYLLSFLQPCEIRLFTQGHKAPANILLMTFNYEHFKTEKKENITSLHIPITDS